MQNKSTRTIAYIIITFILPIGLALFAYSTSFFESRPKLNFGIMIDGPYNLHLQIPTTEKENHPKWHLVVIPEDINQSNRVLTTAQTTIKLLGEKADRVKLAMPNAPQKVLERFPVKSFKSTMNIRQVLQTFLHQKPSAASGDLILIVDPLGQVVTLYNDSLRLDAPLKDLKRLLKYSRIG